MVHIVVHIVIFVNHRKEDSQASVDHIADSLMQRFGELTVFNAADAQLL